MGRKWSPLDKRRVIETSQPRRDTACAKAWRTHAWPLGIWGALGTPQALNEAQGHRDSCLAASALPELFVAGAGLLGTPGQRSPTPPRLAATASPTSWGDSPPRPRLHGKTAAELRPRSSWWGPFPRPRPFPIWKFLVLRRRLLRASPCLQHPLYFPRCSPLASFYGRENQRHGEAPMHIGWRTGWTPDPSVLRPRVTSGCPATFGGGGGRQRVHVGGLPALHHRLAQDLQVHVRRVIGRGRHLPRGAAVLAGGEDGGRGGDAHAAAGTSYWTPLATRGPDPCEAFWGGGGAGPQARGAGPRARGGGAARRPEGRGRDRWAEPGADCTEV